MNFFPHFSILSSVVSDILNGRQIIYTNHCPPHSPPPSLSLSLFSSSFQSGPLFRRSAFKNFSGFTKPLTTQNQREANFTNETLRAKIFDSFMRDGPSAFFSFSDPLDCVCVCVYVSDTNFPCGRPSFCRMDEREGRMR